MYQMLNLLYHNQFSDVYTEIFGTVLCTPENQYSETGNSFWEGLIMISVVNSPLCPHITYQRVHP